MKQKSIKEFYFLCFSFINCILFVCSIELKNPMNNISNEIKSPPPTFNTSYENISKEKK